jgi:hypothetical protein
MLTKRQNFLETIRGGKPDRFVNQYEFIPLLWTIDPITEPFSRAGGPGTTWKDGWGVTQFWGKEQPGPFPVHDDAHKVVKDITKWKSTAKMPKTDFPPEAWADAVKKAEAVDRTEYFCGLLYTCGVFEQLHYLTGLDDCLVNLYEEPEASKELIAYITEYELKYAAEVCKYLKPDLIFHHDDWGSQLATFMSPEMFDEFFLEPYKKIYGFYKSHGVEVIIHHSDCFAATLVPEMIEMGIDVFQGCITTNNVPELVKKYGGKISFMGDLNNGVLDKADWTPELVRKEVERACRGNGKHYFIPCLTAGGWWSNFPGVYEAVSAEIDRMSKEMF